LPATGRTETPPKAQITCQTLPRQRYPAESCTLDRHTTPLLSVTTSGDQNVQKISILFRVTDGGGGEKTTYCQKKRKASSRYYSLSGKEFVGRMQTEGNLAFKSRMNSLGSVIWSYCGYK